MNTLCATSPVITPIPNFKINVLGATTTYVGSSKSPIPIPTAPATPPGTPPSNKAANTQNVFPKWNEVTPPGVGILICRNVKAIYAKAAINPVTAIFNVLFSFI